MEIDVHLGGSWVPCAVVALLDDDILSRRGPVSLQYEADYAVEHLDLRDYRALSVRAPVTLGTRHLPHWPSFLIDLLPQGAARKRIERVSEGSLSDWALLARGAVNPVGNLRVRPSSPPAYREHHGFELAEMVSRGDAFVDHAHELGAVVAGATDTQGEAPKFWVIEDENGRWHPDNGDVHVQIRRHALLKFPVPEAGEFARDILSHEATYQRVAQRLGLRVTPTLPEFLDGALLIPRFDRRFVQGSEMRLGVESIYSISGVLDSAATTLRHDQALVSLARCVSDFQTELIEYVRRDLLNLAVGNRDNHGRNTAVLKDVDGSIRLAPLYDFGPSFLDGRSIARTIRWDGEQPGRRDWNHILRNLATRFEEAQVYSQGWRALAEILRAFAHDLDRLPALMSECGVAQYITDRRRDDIIRLAAELRAIEALA